MKFPNIFRRERALTLPRGPWAMEAETLDFLASQPVAQPTAGPFDLPGMPEAKPYTVQDGIATLEISGPLMKRAPAIFAFLFGATGTDRTRTIIRQAANDPSVTGIMLSIDSPGGTVDGTAELADEIAAAAKKKTVHAYVDGMACSAAYWLASQAGRVTAMRTSLVGCIGTYSVLVDMSKAAEQVGLKVHVIKAGDLKGAGVPGAPITKGQQDATQRLVNSLNAHFLAAVAKGRHMSSDRVKQLATGETWTGDQAKALGLIDAVGSMDDAIAALKARRTGTPSAAAASPSPRPVSAAAASPAVSRPAPVAASPVVSPSGDAAALQSRINELNAEIAGYKQTIAAATSRDSAGRFTSPAASAPAKAGGLDVNAIYEANRRACAKGPDGSGRVYPDAARKEMEAEEQQFRANVQRSGLAAAIYERERTRPSLPA